MVCSLSFAPKVRFIWLIPLRVRDLVVVMLSYVWLMLRFEDIFGDFETNVSKRQKKRAIVTIVGKN